MLKFHNLKKFRIFCSRLKNFSTNIEKSILNDSSCQEQVVTPWAVEGKVDYNKLVQQFGTEIISTDLMIKFENTIQKSLHPWIRRNIFFTHRGLNNFLTAYSRGEPVFLYTGRGPSSDAMHLGHLVPFLFTKWLQDALDCPLVIQISDEEKSAFKNKKFSEIYKLGFDNSKDIIACGFDQEKTFIFSNRDYRLNCKNFEILTTEMKNQTSAKEVKKIFGFDDEASVFMYDWPFYQTAAAYSQSYPHIFDSTTAYCLVPHAIDQDPYFRLARDLSSRMNLYKPSNIMSKFIPALSGDSGKMSSSRGQEYTIFLNDSEKIIKEKILKHSFSGGGGDGSLSDHKKLGGNPDIDIAFQYLKYFEESDEKLENIRTCFSKGELTCGELKNLLIENLVPLIMNIQESKNKVDQATLDEFYKIKPMKCVEFRKNLNFKNKTDLSLEEQELYNYFNQINIEFYTKYHENIKIILEDKIKENEYKISINGPLCKTLLLKGNNKDYYMLLLNQDTLINMKDLKKKMGVNRLMFAERDTVKFLFDKKIDNQIDIDQIREFVLSPFSLINYAKNNSTGEYSNLSILIEESLINTGDINYFNFHPMRNDATTRIKYKDLEKFLSSFKINAKLFNFK